MNTHLKWMTSILLLLCWGIHTNAQSNTPPGNTIYSGTSCSYTYGTVLNASSPFFTQASCDFYSNGPHLLDVFYNFTAVENTHTITVDPLGSNSDLDVVLQIIYYENGTYYSMGCLDATGGGGETTSLTLNNLTAGNNYYIRIYDYGNVQPDYGDFGVCVTHSPSNTGSPDLAYQSHIIDDDNANSSSGNDNGLVNPGETIELMVRLENTGNQTATNVSATLYTSDPDINITDDYESFNDIPSGGMVYNNADFDFEVSASCPEKDVQFCLDINADEGNWTDCFTIHVYAVPCSYSLSPTSNSFPSSGGTGTATVNTQTSCYWSSNVSSGSSWISITSGFNGLGTGGTINYSVAPNSGSNSRTGEITVGPATHTIFQSGASPCNYSLSSNSETLPGTASTGSFQVQASANTCAWNAQVTQGSSWLSLNNGNGTGNGTVSYSATENTSGVERYGIISVEGQNHYVTQTNNSYDPDVWINTPNGGETYYVGEPAYINFEVYGDAMSVIFYFSSNGGQSWTMIDFENYPSDGAYNLAWTWPTVNSSACHIKAVALYGPNGFELENTTPAFTVTTPNSSPGVAFSLNSNLAHLYWPYENSSWENRNGWSGGQGGPDRPQDGTGGGNGHGEGGHDLGEYYADDWNRAGGDCDKNFYAPLSGTVIFRESGCANTCVRACGPSSCCGNGFGNAIIIRSDQDPSYAFKVSHLNNVFVNTGTYVNAGDLIGEVGSTGNSYGSHAHCTLYKNISDYHESGETCMGRLQTGLSCGIDHSAPYTPNQFACNFMFDAVMGGSGGGEQEFELLLSGNATICQGQSVTLTPSVTGTEYTWNTGDNSPTLTVSESGLYHVVVTTATGDILYSEIIAITVQPYSQASIYALPESNYCQGDTVWLSALDVSNLDEGSLEGEPYGISWSNGMTDMTIPVTSPGDYGVTVQDPAGCEQTTDQTTISFWDNTPPTIQENDNFLAASLAVAYQWYLNGNPIPNATGQFHEATETGYYTVETTDANGCVLVSDPLFVSTTSDIRPEADYTLRIHPNPNKGRFLIHVGDANFTDAEINLFDPAGKRVMQLVGLNFTSQYTLDAQQLPSGVYTLSLRSGNQNLSTKVVIMD